MDKVIFEVNGVPVEVPKEEVSKAIETGKVEVQAENLITYSKDDFDTFTSNLSNEEYKKGKTAGEEMLIKTAKEKNGLDFEGKSFEKYDEALKNKIISEANIKPNEKITELENKFNTLQESYASLETTHNEYKQGISEKQTRQKKDAEILKYIPKDVIVESDLALMALKQKAGLDVEFSEDGKPILLINGQKAQDNVMNDVLITQDAVLDKLTALNLIAKKEGGRGQGDQVQGKKGSYEAFVKEMEANEVPMNSEKFQSELNKRLKDGTLTM